MLHEYAVAPDLLKQWAANDRDYYEFFREYGLGSPRISSSFPKQKASRFISYFLREAPADEQSLQGRRYVEMVKHMAEALICREGIACEAGDWIQDVVNEDARFPFHAVLSPANLDSPRSLTPETMYAPGSVWKHVRQDTVQRRYKAIAPYLKDMLRLAKKKVVIIDTYGWNDRAVGFIGQLIGDVCTDRCHSNVPEILVFYKERVDRHNAGNASPAAAKIKADIENALPAGSSEINVHVTELREKPGEDVFHNRCILTEHGGVSLGHGVDVSENPNHSDEITLLERKVYENKWSQFIDSPCFEVVTST